MRCTLVSVVLALAASAEAQTPLPVHFVGYHDVGWLNTSGQGSQYLSTRVFYPSPTGGVDAPIASRPKGWPVIVFLHGYGLQGQSYTELAGHWASKGFVVAALNQSMFSLFTEAADGNAMYAALAVENGTDSAFFAGTLDLQRIAIAGHSMGGAAMTMVLANNPGYRCGFAFAPAFPGPTYSQLVDVPVGIAVGAGDLVTPWFLHSQPLFATMQPADGLKAWYLLDNGCDHLNVAGLVGAAAPQFARTCELSVGFFRHFLELDSSGLDTCLGPQAQHDPLMLLHEFDVARPRIWAAEPLGIGQTVRISVANQGGPAAILAAPSAGWTTATPFGELLLDPNGTFAWTTGLGPGRRLDAFLTVPNSVSLVGSRIALQGLAPTISAPLRLGSAVDLLVGQ